MTTPTVAPMQPKTGRRTVIVRIKDLKGAAYNPTTRTEEGRRLRDLRGSLTTHGQLMPVLIDRDNNVADGHRRIAAAVGLGWTSVECLVTPMPVSKVWLEASAQPLTVTEQQWLDAWKTNKDIPETMSKRFTDLEAAFGVDFLDLMREFNVGYSAVRYGTAMHKLLKMSPSHLKPLLVALIQARKCHEVGILLRDKSTTEDVKRSRLSAVLKTLRLSKPPLQAV